MAGGAAEAIRAARRGVVLAARPGQGLALFTGKDAADLLHRLTTAAVLGLGPGQGTAAVFTTNKGRILDLVTLHRLPEGILAVTAPGRAAAVIAWVDRYTFREQVKAEDRSATHTAIGLYGAGAGRFVARIFGDAAGSLPRHHLATVDCGGIPASLVHAWPIGGDGWIVIVPAASAGAARTFLLGADAGIVEAGPEAIEALRIEAGLPAPGSELTEDHNPWEARLDEAIAFNKGCYVGQEVIARLHTYRKVARLLVRLELDGAAAPAAGAAILRGADRIGSVTSAAAMPGEDKVVAIGYVRDEDAAAAGPVTIEADTGPRPARLL